jgi:hypothetical protein
MHLAGKLVALHLPVVRGLVRKTKAQDGASAGVDAWRIRPRSRRSGSDEEFGAKGRASSSRSAMARHACVGAVVWTASDRAIDAVQALKARLGRR